MVASKDLLLAAVGFVISLYGGYAQDLFIAILGMVTLIFMIYLALDTHESEIQLLKTHIQIVLEMDNVRRRLDAIEKRGNL
ncbi:hypothetical protein HOA92_05205 [archaeon]|jgi:hypothetical protein|nr:hypothetical protein [archaeon]MBT6762414.1 hypothetical protein [archaeon]